jgi:homoserine kinase type II
MPSPVSQGDGRLTSGAALTAKDVPVITACLHNAPKRLRQSGRPGGCWVIISAVATAEQVRAVLRSTWHCVVDDCVALPGGVTTTGWAVTVGGRQYLVKSVPAVRRAQFEAGLAAAEHLVSQHAPAATAVRAVDGGLTGPCAGDVVALLRQVPGRPLDGADPVDQQWWGDALGAAHRRLSAFRHPGMARFQSVRAEVTHLDSADPVRPVVTAAVAAMRKLCVTDQLTYGVLHGDPAPSAFRLDPLTGRLGLAEWGPVVTGPLLYDVASAVVHAGGTGAAADLIDGYLAAGPVPRDELEAALPTMLMFRWAVLVDHFAARLSTRPDGEDDRRRLAAARDALAGLAGDAPA